MTPEAALLAGLLAGLFGSTHCLGMCGGIAGMLHAQLPGDRPGLAAGFHLGRIASYLAIALVATGIGMLPATLLPETAPLIMRVLLGALLVAMAAYIALPGRFRDRAGELAAPFTRRLMPLLARFLPVRSLDNALGLGLLWGLLPCGLLYSVVAAAVFLADPLATTAMVLAFGIGTVPLLLGTGLAVLKFRSAVNRRGLRYTAAFLVAFSGLLVALGPWLAHSIDHPWMQFVVDCVTPRR
ncbi:sulfite exporter TauE/SafE family protein [Wenzhouxiangella sp. AB-CW3]|uniref:sulfite exporter TauE/SafE family protein n=1 Tax=Wenzhouxiangella sp. AB-CW3 TaxID=2771012 RepID=UPI00168BD061|nr:sulfite exporter TauE/SafE family protein [Wenzhouxiangella sp. AB-CW3]QOC22251.1 sulfite exporter TauE/SafE family protein [Wenzhouxiangella sp. AB-CW3]